MSFKFFALPVQVGEQVTLQLLRRPRDSIIPSEVQPGEAEEIGAQKLAAGQRPTAGKKPDALPEPGAAAWVSGTQGGAPDQTPAPEEGSTAGLEAAAAGILCNRFAKFTTVADPMPLWLATAGQLAAYAAQVWILEWLINACTLNWISCFFEPMNQQ